MSKNKFIKILNEEIKRHEELSEEYQKIIENNKKQKIPNIKSVRTYEKLLARELDILGVLYYLIYKTG